MRLLTPALSPPSTTAARSVPLARRVTTTARRSACALVALATLGSPRPATAACEPDVPPLADGGSVTCSGADETGFDGTMVTNLTITTSGVTVLTDADGGTLDAAIVVEDGNSITLGADATVNVGEANGSGVLGRDDNSVVNEGTINVNVSTGTGINLRDSTDPTGTGIPPAPGVPFVRNAGTIDLTADGAVGIRTNSNYDVENDATGTIQVRGAGATGILGGNDNIINNEGTIVVDGDDGRAISLGNNTGLPLSNGAISSGTITINGARGIAIEAGDDVGVAFTGGTVDLVGDESRGLSLGNRVDTVGAQANVTNAATMNVDGAGAIGMQVGDGWIEPGNTAGTRNFDTINVRGEGAVGIFAGDTSNTTGEHDSFVLNNVGAVIDVTGVDAIGVSLGGNGILDPGNGALDSAETLTNLGSILGGADAGPLVEFRNFSAGFENRVRNEAAGSITADLTNIALPDRGIAVRGSAGSDHVSNAGSIVGDLDLGDGDDTFTLESTGSFTGTYRGGNGDDTVVLGANAGPALAFDLDQTTDVETIRVEGLSAADPGWSLLNTSGFTGLIDVEANGSLTQAAGLDFDGLLENLGRIAGDVTFGAGANSVRNGGAIEGDADLGDGDDSFLLEASGSFTGTLDAGLGEDTFALGANTGGVLDFDFSRTDGFETIRVEGAAAADPGWNLTNTAGFTGLVEIEADGSLTQAAALDFDGTLVNSGRLTGDVVLGASVNDVTNSGAIIGNVDLGDGDDTFRQNPGATLTGMLDGGLGDDTLTLGAPAGALETFDLGTLLNVPDVRVLGVPSTVSGWRLVNGAAFGGTLTVQTNGLITQTAADVLEADVVNDGSIAGDLTLGPGANTLTNNGAIPGNVDLGDGDDTFLQSQGASLTGMLDGGLGDDSVLLDTTSGSVTTFDLSLLQNIPNLRIQDTGDANDGAWTLSDGAGFTGTVFVDAGAALIQPDAVTLGGALEVAPTGAIGATVFTSGPGITVAGDARFDGTLAVALDPALAALDPAAQAGDYRLIQVDGNSVGTFSTEILPDDAGVLQFETTYDADGLLFSIIAGTFGSVGQGASNRAIGAHLDAIRTDMTGSAELLSLLDEYETGATDVDGFLSALSPEAYDAQATIAIESGRRLARMLFERPRDCLPGDVDRWTPDRPTLDCHRRALSAWVAGTGRFRSRDAFSGRPEYDAEVGGGVFGIDFLPHESLELTLAISGQQATIDVQGRGESDLSLIEAMVAGAWTWNSLRLQATAGYGHGFHEATRRIAFSADGVTPLEQTGEDDFESRRVTAGAQAGYLVSVGPVDVEPTLGVDWVFLDQDEVEEAGGFATATLAERDDHIVTGTAGLRLSTLYHHTRYLHQNLEWIDGVWRPTVAVRWRQYLTGYDRSIDARLAGAPDTVGGFRVEAEEDDGGFEVEAALSFVPKHANRLQFDLRYDLYRAAHTLDHDLTARVRIGF